MTLAPWRSPLARALHRHRSQPESRYLQLATVRSNGQPANRTVVFRGFLGGGDRLQFITDRRSAKLEHIAFQPWAEACWYFPKTREQFRLLGSLTVVTTDTSEPDLQAARRDLWQVLSDQARSQFAWPAPAQPRSQVTAANFAIAAPDREEPLPTFCLILLLPTSVDHLELRGDPQSRSRYTWVDGQWQVEAITP